MSISNQKQSDYQSEITQFINQLKQQNPSLEENQREGRALLWDKSPRGFKERKCEQTSCVKQKAYVYY